MQIETLIRMANQIGAFFEAMPEHDEALAGIAHHLARFWEPRMRRELLSHIDSTADAGLSGIVAEAIGRHRGSLD